MKCKHCPNKVQVKGAQLCSKHYSMLRHYGDPLHPPKEYDMRSKHSLYVNWMNMMSRCYNPNSTSYEYYGGRGITVCERWHNFWNFAEDMGDKPTPTHTIDRIDHDGNYEPTNCRWATRREQNYNKSDNNEFIGVRFDDKTKGYRKWRSYLRVGDLYVYDYSHTVEEAIEKRKQYEREYLPA